MLETAVLLELFLHKNIEAGVIAGLLVFNAGRFHAGAPCADSISVAPAAPDDLGACKTRCGLAAASRRISGIWTLAILSARLSFHLTHPTKRSEAVLQSGADSMRVAKGAPSVIAALTAACSRPRPSARLVISDSLCALRHICALQHFALFWSAIARAKQSGRDDYRF
jgi:hypothetical protein